MNANLPQYDRVLFGKPPIALALAQIRFPVLPRFPDGSYVDGFHQTLRNEYPKSERIVQYTLQLASEQSGGHIPGSILWRFSTVDDRWSVVLSENALTLEVRGYSSIEEFADRFAAVVEQSIATLNPTIQTRLGLRYVNEIRVPGAEAIEDWDSLIRPEVLGLSRIASNLFERAAISTARQEIEIQLPDGALVIRHGLHTGTSVEPKPQADPPRGHYYLVDMDRSDSTVRRLDPVVISDQLRSYNDLMYRFFRWTILPPLFEELEPNHGG